MKNYLLQSFLVLFIANFGQAALAKDAAKMTGDKIEFYLGMYKIDCKEFPLTKDGLAALTKKPAGKCPNWGPDAYIDQIPKDSWGRDWEYSSDGKTYTLKSLGKDGKPGGTGDNADVIFNKAFETKKAK